MLFAGQKAKERFSSRRGACDEIGSVRRKDASEICRAGKKECVKFAMNGGRAGLAIAPLFANLYSSRMKKVDQGPTLKSMLLL